ncbi:MAG: hypothetical protein FWB85_04270 [Chitinispirillia bacterium]|nr:hypothetical protein [Chitinispirillia bacterium]MCL2241557.1 hypothetical protein [Chitinispirillia bacterium]
MGRSKVNPGGQSGSAIVGVLVATVFIGIVTASMVKHTGSQSRSSGSYGTVQIAESTLKSGVIATETGLMDQAKAVRIKNVIQNILNNNAPSINDNSRFVFGSAAQKVPLAAGVPQSFCSRLDSVGVDGYGRVLGKFNIRSGTGTGGKDIRTAEVFGELGGLEVEWVDESDKNGLWGENALFTGGNMETSNGLIINGNVTIGGNLTLNGDAGIVFNGNTWVDKNFTDHTAGSTFSQALRVEGTANYHQNTKVPANNSDAADALSRAEDPRLDLSKIPSSVTRLGINDIADSWGAGSGGLSRSKFQSAIASVPQSKRYNGHVVVELDGGYLQGQDWQWSGETFNEKVIFVLKGDAQLRQRFFDCGPGASVLIYLGGQSSLQPGFDPGRFRGLIYAEAGNTSPMILAQGGSGSSITGAVYSMGSGLLSVHGAGMPVTYSSDVLGAFADLRAGSGSGGSRVPVVNFIDGDESIDVRAFGYYFF